MKFTSMERCAVSLGVVLFLGGFAAVLWPHAGIVPHETRSTYGDNGTTGLQMVTRSGARVSGVLAMLLGAAIIVVIVQSNKE